MIKFLYGALIKIVHKMLANANNVWQKFERVLGSNNACKRKLSAFIGILGICSVVIIITTGCWDARDIEEKANVLVLAVDKADDEYECAIMLPIIKASSSAKGEGEQSSSGAGSYVIAAKGSTFLGAISQLLNKVDSPLFFGYTMELLLGEELCREDGINSILEGTRRLWELKRSVWPIVVRGKAIEALKTDTKTEMLAFYLQAMLENPKLYDDKNRSNTLGDIYHDLSAKSVKSSVIPYLDFKKEEVTIYGRAIFAEDKMVGIIKDDEISVLSNLRNKERGTIVRIETMREGKKGEIAFLPFNIKRDIEVSGDPLSKITYKVKLDGILLGNNSGISSTDPEGCQEITNLLNDKYQAEAKKLIEKMKNWGSDTLLLGFYLHAFYPQLFCQDHWIEQFKELPIEVIYDISLSSVGFVID